MEVVYAILIIAGIIIAVIIWEKAKSATRKAVNQKVLFRGESKEGQHIVSEPMNIETSASIDDVLNEVAARVTVAPDVPKVKAALYESKRSEKAIAYRHGNKFTDNFLAIIALAEHDGKTVGEFKIHEWKEADGMIVGQDAMRKLHKQVEAAIAALEQSDEFAEASKGEKQPV